MADTHISAQETARRTGLSTGALAKRRYLKKAPNGWIYLSSNAASTPKVKWSDSSLSARRPDTRSGPAHAEGLARVTGNIVGNALFSPVRIDVFAEKRAFEALTRHPSARSLVSEEMSGTWLRGVCS